MRPPSEQVAPAEVRIARSAVASSSGTVGALATALALAAGALVERPDGAPLVPVLALFGLAIALSLVARGRRAAFDAQR